MRAQSLTATLAYTYTADGLRVGQDTNGTLTTYAWDWASPVPELLARSTGSQSTPYLLGYETLGWAEGGVWRYVLPDARGSVRQAADAAGAVVRVREWEPYGVEVGGPQEGLGYTGEWQDAAVGLVYLRARWYAPGVGVFTAPDPFPGVRQEPMSLHPYLYVLANPVSRVDPRGLYSIREIKEIFHARLYNPDVLRVFEAGYPLEGRWGWLEVLRVASDGDRLVVLNRIGCADNLPGTYIGRVVGEFHRSNGELLIGNLSHLQAACEGERFGVLKMTHCVPDLRYGEICDPVITHWELKVPYIIDVQHRYMGLRCDFAALEVKEAVVSLISLLVPLLGTEEADNAWELIRMAWEVANAGSEEGAIAALNKFNETAGWLLLKLQMKYGPAAIPQIATLMTAIDFGRDLKSLIESAGCAWLP
ncbi:MAG: RHS repeat-associated core domain-containing protein [Candidatus Methanomethyliaceae archaeon]